MTGLAMQMRITLPNILSWRSVQDFQNYVLSLKFKTSDLSLKFLPETNTSSLLLQTFPLRCNSDGGDAMRSFLHTTFKPFNPFWVGFFINFNLVSPLKADGGFVGGSVSHGGFVVGGGVTPPSSASPVWIQISPPFLSYPTLLFLVVVVSGGGAMGGFVLCNTPFLVETLSGVLVVFSVEVVMTLRGVVLVWVG
ncbi:transmembrane protein, putative [Medicago truncatula]|uniref:Transmembrane protein, putative n=1 Tax=Medicago truncatula TaxID=3880 RepID=A0A072V1Q7_MEDTR|nr:transmembrane protein, putative [Medicago truncatula]